MNHDVCQECLELIEERDAARTEVEKLVALLREANDSLDDAQAMQPWTYKNGESLRRRLNDVIAAHDKSVNQLPTKT